MSKLTSQLKSRNRKQVTLDNGAIIVVRRVDSMDYLELGQIPQVLFSNFSKLKNLPVEEQAKAILDNKDSTAEVHRVLFGNCVLGALVDGKLEPIKFVQKPAIECEEDEVSISDDLTSNERNRLVAAINGVEGSVADKSATFRGRTRKPY